MKKRLDIRKVIGLLLFTSSVACQPYEDDSPLAHSSEIISFRVIQMEDEYASRSLFECYGAHVGNSVLRSENSVDTLAMDVFVSNINENISYARGVPVTSDNLSSFGVYASIQEEGKDIQSFFNNLKVGKDVNNSFENEKSYYWPGSSYNLKFMAVSPYKPQGLLVNMDANNALPASLDYTVPTDAVNQNDLLLAVTSDYQGNYYETVNLNFSHLCSAVNVKVGTIPQGSIKAITFKNIYNKGTYTIANDAWSVNNVSKDNFSVDFVGAQNEYPTYGTETGNPQINDASATFMMIPQTLPDDAEMIVSFTHTVSGVTEELTCSLAGIEWAKATTTNYLINISPYYELYIEEENVATADCHYDMRVIHIKNEYDQKEWTLSSDQEWAKFRLLPADYETNADYQSYNDYWSENHQVITHNIFYDRNGNKTGDTITVDYGLSNSISSSGNQVVMVYLEENVGEGTESRSATLTLQTGDKEVSSVELKQYYPLWNNNLAFERIEEDETGYKWGFASTRTVTYTYPAIDAVNWGDYQYLWDFVKNNRNTFLIGWLCKIIYDNVIGDRETARSNAYTTFYDTYYNTTTNQSTNFVTMIGSADRDWSATLDYGKLNNISTSGDGLANTIAILTYGGSSTTSDAETWLVNNGLTKGAETSSDDQTKIPETAAYRAIMRNKCNLTTRITNTTRIVNGETFTETTSVNELSLSEDGIQWFLPSATEISSLVQTACDSDSNNNDESLSGSYWTSTSSSNLRANSFDASGSVGTTDRTTPLKVRAARKKP